MTGPDPVSAPVASPESAQAEQRFPFAPTAKALQLPVHAYAEELVQAIRRHQVVVVEGPTGCGKTTQLPAMLLRAGLTDKCIAVTQPRRIAAVSVSWRIAEETGATLGREVGYAIRFDDLSGPDTRIRLCTDGILLQEARFQPDFDRYGVIVVDEAHERSLNIDFLLGLLHDALLRRADLRVVISSATIDPGRFVRFFEDKIGHVPVVHINARPHPVTIQYKPLSTGNADELALAMATEAARIDKQGLPGHILAFLSGEDTIRRTQKSMQNAGLGRNCEVLLLYGALTREEQERVFRDYGRRKIILATNIAETSITIDDVRFIFDSGIAKVPRVQVRSGVTVLREEGISKASADQRAGRAGRTAPGTCIRFYDERSYKARPQFTDEEILRLDLAEVALRLLDLGIRDIEHFAFPTAPPRGRMFAALDTLYALGAIDGQRNLLPIGKKMAAYPLSPALARIVLEAGETAPEVLSDVCVVAAWLSSRSPMSMPTGQEDAARKAHGSWAHPLGDALAALKCFTAWKRAEDRAKFCQQHYLDNHLLAFIDSAHNQLLRQAEDQGYRDTSLSGSGPAENTQEAAQKVAHCVLMGFPGNVLQASGRFYQTTDGDRVLLHPGSCLYPQGPRFVVAAEIVVGTRPYARTVTAIRGAWLAQLRPDLIASWGLEKEKVAKVAPAPAAPQIRTLTIGTVTLAVDDRKGKPRIELLASQIPQLMAADLRELPAEALRWQCRLLVGTLVFAQGATLGTVLPVLDLMPLPQPGEVLSCPVPEGALLELDRNRHALLMHLTDLLAPSTQTGGKRNGWVTLIANGGGGYWYEVTPDFRDALQTTLPSLQQLQEDLENDPDAAQVYPVLEQVQGLHERATAAWDKAQRHKHGGGRR